MKIAKYHGTGNDFVMVDDMAGSVQLEAEVIAALCDRHRGVGADGLIRVAAAPGGGADFFMDYYNANGELAEMCGNGIRCLAKFVYDRGLTSAHEIDVQTRAGVKHLVLQIDDRAVQSVTVDMGTPALQRTAIPMAGGDPTAKFVGQPLEVAGRTYTATAVSMGNPHCVLFLDPADDLGAFDVPGIGGEVEHRSEFPNRANVEFVQVTDGVIELRVWERGSGETMACGTGACAALVATSLAGLTGREADVRFPGGVLHVRWAENDHLFMTGPAVCVFDAELDPAWLSRVQPVGAER